MKNIPDFKDDLAKILSEKLYPIHLKASEYLVNLFKKEDPQALR